MDSDLITVKMLINRVLFKFALINISCKCYFIVDQDFVIELWSPRVKILFKFIIGFIKENIKEPWVEIIEIIKFFIDIQGYRRNIFAYVVFTLLNHVIIGLPWIKEDDVIIRLITNIFIINSYGLIVLIKIIPVLLEVKELIVALFVILVKRAREYQKPLMVFNVLLKDITKLLYFKIIRTLAEI